MPGEAPAALSELLTRVQGSEGGTITPPGKAGAAPVRRDAPRARARGAMHEAERIHELLASADPPHLAPPGAMGGDRFITTTKRDLTPGKTKIARPSPAALPDGPDRNQPGLGPGGRPWESPSLLTRRRGNAGNLTKSAQGLPR